MSISGYWQKVKDATVEDWKKASKKRKVYLVLFGYPIGTPLFLALIIPVFVIVMLFLLLALGMKYLIWTCITIFEHKAFTGFCLLLITIALIILLTRN